MKHLKRIELLQESVNYSDFFIIYNTDRIVSHITSEKNAEKIMEDGFITGFELGVSEKRKAIFFADRDVNYGIYARNKEGEIYEGEEIGEILLNIKSLKLLNMTYKNQDGVFINHKKYKDINTRGELYDIPYDIDGTISYLEDGRIYEICLKKDVANDIPIGKKRII